MAKIVTVHGTFAHIETPTGDAEGGSFKQWWNPDSDFEKSLKRHVDSDGSSGAPGSGIEFQQFVWNGENSELARRRAGSRLLSDLKALEEKGEKYCVLAHSHGGSIISSALQEAAAMGMELNGLKRWITIGTPFLKLRPESYLFLRLPLLLKAMFVASLMLLIMFFFYMAGELISGRIDLSNLTNRFTFFLLLVPAILTALPFIAFYTIALYIDDRKLFFYRKRNQRWAEKTFGNRWLPLTHEDDEAVRGLASLSTINLNIFHKNFVVSPVSLLSVFVLPFVYIWIINSPQTINSIFNYLKNNVYYVNASQQEFENVDQLRAYWIGLGMRQNAIEKAGKDTPKGQELQAEFDNYKAEYQKFYNTTMKDSDNVLQILRVHRFDNNFIKNRTENNQFVECNDGRLCGNGNDWAINAKLLFYPVFDEMFGLVVFLSFENAELRLRYAGALIYILLVPVVFGAVAISIVLLFQFVGRILSQLLSGSLDRQAWHEIRRTALGNDTETEVAVTAVPSPNWLSVRKDFLPSPVSKSISTRSNEEMAASINRIRSAISEFALLQEKGGQLNSALNYLTWRELIHTSYFDVPEFQKLVSRAIADSDGFQPSAAFKADPEFHTAQSWLQKMDRSEAQ